jgi:hypothetical protein
MVWEQNSFPPSYPCSSARENDHETCDTDIGRRARAHKHARSGAKQQQRHEWRGRRSARRVHERSRHRFLNHWNHDGERNGCYQPWRRYPQPDESFRQHAGAEFVAERIDLSSDRAGLRRREVSSARRAPNGAGPFSCRQLRMKLTPSFLAAAFSQGRTLPRTRFAVRDRRQPS